MRRVDAGPVSMVWGNRALAKAMLRDESKTRHLERPLAERLRIALSMVRPSQRHGRAAPRRAARCG